MENNQPDKKVLGGVLVAVGVILLIAPDPGILNEILSALSFVAGIKSITAGNHPKDGIDISERKDSSIEKYKKDE